MVVAQVVERSLPTSGARGSNPIIGCSLEHLFTVNCFETSEYKDKKDVKCTFLKSYRKGTDIERSKVLTHRVSGEAASNDNKWFPINMENKVSQKSFSLSLSLSLSVSLTLTHSLSLSLFLSLSNAN